jgi:excisionase family DNA binding protein
MKSIIKWFRCLFIKEYLTSSEVAELLKCDISTVYNWTKKGKLKKYCNGDKTYYKRSEVESALIAI